MLKEHFHQEQSISISRKSGKSAMSSFKTQTQKGSIKKVETGTVNLEGIQRYCLSLGLGRPKPDFKQIWQGMLKVT